MMNTYTTTTKEKIGTDEIILIGLDSFCTESIGKKLANATINTFNGSETYSVYRDLRKRIKHPEAQLPRAIICSYELLKSEKFQLLENLKKPKELKSIPVIAIAEDFSKVDIKEALVNGIDDCYPADTDWNDVHKRIVFLEKYKKDLVSVSLVQTAHQEYKLPLGKRIFDIVFASMVILLISPILLFIAICIKLESRGPIFYLSKRAGTGYKIFDFIKFRSMCIDADAKLAQLVHLNQYNQTGSVSFVKIKNDPRITRIGRFIRKTSLDELPQLFNVLRGEMSIVGNRPLPLYEAEQLTKDDWAKRFLAPAGMTGLWQINKQSDTLDNNARIGLDIEYAEKFSLPFDIKIIMKTLPAMLQKDEE